MCYKCNELREGDLHGGLFRPDANDLDLVFGLLVFEGARRRVDDLVDSFDEVAAPVVLLWIEDDGVVGVVGEVAQEK